MKLLLEQKQKNFNISQKMKVSIEKRIKAHSDIMRMYSVRKSTFHSIEQSKIHFSPCPIFDIQRVARI